MAQAPKHTHQASWTAVTEAGLSLQHVPSGKMTTFFVCVFGAILSSLPSSPVLVMTKATCGDFFRFPDSEDQSSRTEISEKA